MESLLCLHVQHSRKPPAKLNWAGLQPATFLPSSHCVKLMKSFAFNGQWVQAFPLLFLRLPAAACIYHRLQLHCLKWLTASDIYGYVRVCIWIPLFFWMRHTTKMHQWDHAADAHALPVSCRCSWHSVDIVQKLSEFDTAPGRRWSLWRLWFEIHKTIFLCSHFFCCCPFVITTARPHRQIHFTCSERHVNKTLSGGDNNSNSGQQIVENLFITLTFLKIIVGIKPAAFNSGCIHYYNEHLERATLTRFVNEIRSISYVLW